MAAEESVANKAVTQEQAKVKTQQPPKPEVEKQSNCAACNKQIKRIKRYYRNGKFYCDKKCWRKSITESKETKK